MLKLFATIFKEFLILIRDKSGLAVMFVMPVALVTIMALIQDAPFKDYQELRIPAILINNDNGELGAKIESGLTASKIFSITKPELNELEAAKKVADGKFDICIVIPKNATEGLNGRVKMFVGKTLSELGVSPGDTTHLLNDTSSTNVAIYFKPGIKKSFKNSVLNSIRQVATKLESESLIASFKKELNPGDTTSTAPENFGDFIRFDEKIAGDELNANKELNSVQHNVPAWAMFGMFFIVISLAGSIIKEREDGSYLRILTMPGSYLTVLAGKITAYLAVCLVQCWLMLLVGVFLMPLLGLPKLIFGDAYFAIFIVALCCGLAATGYGVLVGTLFNSHQQSSTFGSVSVVIMAALGGIWVPVFVMPEAVKVLAEFSPLYWGLNAFQHLFLGDGTLQPIAGYIYKLLLFFVLTLSTALFLNKIRKN
jgi:ABC-2 type transport system permease protein